MDLEMETMNQIAEGNLVLLWFGEEDTTYLVEVTRGKRVGIHCGKPLLVDEWIGRDFGSTVACDHGTAHLLKPTLDDLMMKASRESGIVYPKDAGYLLLKTGIQPGAKVLEIGTGSGSLTMALATMVQPHGKVYTFDRRTDLPKNAEKNITRAGLQNTVVFGQRVAGDSIPEKGFDAVVLDIPQPWEEVTVVREALKNGGHLVSLNPTFNQIERMAEALRRNGFIRVDSVEILERPILAREGKTRPVMRMVSHTEFMVFGTKAGEGPQTLEKPKDSIEFKNGL